MDVSLNFGAPGAGTAPVPGISTPPPGVGRPPRSSGGTVLDRGAGLAEAGAAWAGPTVSARWRSALSVGIFVLVPACRLFAVW